MTIDEAIQRENKIAEENQKIVDTEIVFDDVSLSQFYCDDTEVIEEHLENYKKCAEYHKNIAEWLEELKAYREIGTVEECRNSVLDIERAYNKAIDDFAEKVIHRYHELPTTLGYTEEIVKEIAEQLKAGGK